MRTPGNPELNKRVDVLNSFALENRDYDEIISIFDRVYNIVYRKLERKEGHIELVFSDSFRERVLQNQGKSLLLDTYLKKMMISIYLALKLKDNNTCNNNEIIIASLLENPFMRRNISSEEIFESILLFVDFLLIQKALSKDFKTKYTEESIKKLMKEHQKRTKHE